MTTSAAFIGLGVIGYPMAGYLAKAGFTVTVYNRTQSKADDWVREHGGAVATTPKDAAAGADFVFTCVGNDDDLRSVTMGEHGAFHGLKSGAVFVDHTTASATIAEELCEEAKARNAGFLDAPVSGGQAGAENGVLTCMVGGDQESFDRAKPLMECYTKMLQLLGPVGYGQLAKMVNQICIAGTVQGLAEALHFAKATSQDGDAVLNVISKGATQSWQMENRGTTMLRNEFEFGFAVDWMRKDLAIILDQARKANANLPLTALVDQFYAEVQNLGGDRWDTSSLIVPLERFRAG
jgi:3-hydroxyisobutyrate dehydrogenase-like beta-hydroxyacid dehydrogenase